MPPVARVPKISTPTFGAIKKFIQTNGITHRNELIRALPLSERQTFTFVHDSKSPSKACISKETPRAIAFGTLIISFNDSQKPGCKNIEIVETITENGKPRHVPRLIRVGDDGKILELVDKPTSCRNCHGDSFKGKWDGYGQWHTAFGDDPGEEVAGTDVAEFVRLRDKVWRQPGNAVAELDWTEIGDTRAYPFNAYNADGSSPDRPHYPNRKLTSKLVAMSYDNAANAFSEMSDAMKAKLLHRLSCTKVVTLGGGETTTQPYAEMFDLRITPRDESYYWEGGQAVYYKEDYWIGEQKTPTLLFLSEQLPWNDPFLVRHKLSRGMAPSAMCKILSDPKVGAANASREKVVPAPPNDLVQKRCVVGPCHSGEREKILGSRHLREYVVSGRMPMDPPGMPPMPKLTAEEISTLLGTSM